MSKRKTKEQAADASVSLMTDINVGARGRFARVLKSDVRTVLARLEELEARQVELTEQRDAAVRLHHREVLRRDEMRKGRG